MRLIPFLEDWQAFLNNRSSSVDMWCTYQQFIDILAGNHEEHVLLLAGYFMWLNAGEEPEGANVLLVLGTGIPEGDTVRTCKHERLIHNQ